MTSITFQSLKPLPIEYIQTFDGRVFDALPDVEELYPDYTWHKSIHPVSTTHTQSFFAQAEDGRIVCQKYTITYLGDTFVMDNEQFEYVTLSQKDIANIIWLCDEKDVPLLP